MKQLPMPAFSNAPAKVYATLLRRFGPQGWWPTTRPGKLSPEYYPRRYAVAAEHEQFEICAGAILTQNTAWSNVEKAIENLNAAEVFRLETISRMRRERLAALLRPSGYYNQKTERLQRFARHISERYRGSMSRFFARPAETVRAELLSLPGVGPETADSMLLYAGNKASFVIDAYTFRLGQKLGWFTERNYDMLQGFFHARVPRSVEVYNEFHALIVAVCKECCRKKPLCEGCPLQPVCFHGSGRKN